VPDPSFTDLALVTYCPRKLYYRRQVADRAPPASTTATTDLAFRYATLVEPGGLAEAPIAVTPAAYRRNLARAEGRLEAWPQLVDPPARDVYLRGRQSHGVAHKVLDRPLAPSIVSPGEPPTEGVWRPHAVRAVAAAKALAWERERPVDRAYLEYAAHGVIRRVRLTTRRKAAYRRALRTVRSIDGPPPRLRDVSKCRTCEYRNRCGVSTRTLRSLRQ